MDRGGFYRFGAKGAADIVVVIEGRFIGLECKDGKGKQSLDQQAFQAALEKAGGIYFLIRSFDECLEVVEDASAD
jgi:hypothetical protein